MLLSALLGGVRSFPSFCEVFFYAFMLLSASPLWSGVWSLDSPAQQLSFIYKHSRPHPRPESTQKNQSIKYQLIEILGFLCLLMIRLIYNIF